MFKCMLEFLTKIFVGDCTDFLNEAEQLLYAHSVGSPHCRVLLLELIVSACDSCCQLSERLDYFRWLHLHNSSAISTVATLEGNL